MNAVMSALKWDKKTAESVTGKSEMPLLATIRRTLCEIVRNPSINASTVCFFSPGRTPSIEASEPSNPAQS